MPDLTLVHAQALVQRALEQATQEFGRPICVAVCDDRGLLLAFARMDGAPARSVRISQGKAYTAARTDHRPRCTAPAAASSAISLSA